MLWKKHLLRLIVWTGVVNLIVAASLVVASATVAPNETVANEPYVRCEQTSPNDFQCYKKHFTKVTNTLSPRVALADLKRRYDKNPFVYSQCHQLAHVIGNTVAETTPDISDAFLDGDAICWSGYYHGVVERFAQLKGRDGFAAEADNLCAKIVDKQRFGFDYYNCVHGLGHGVMAITRNQLFEALDLCQNLTGEWEKRSCYGGVFMENVMADNRGHGTTGLKPDDLLYPCTAVDALYKEECYKMQTSYALTKNGYNFGHLFELCLTADPGYKRTCAQSIGRDASGQSVSDIAGTISRCSLAQSDEQAEDCYIGAAKDFVSYHHSDVKARALCDAIPPKLKPACEGGLLQQWSTMKPS